MVSHGQWRGYRMPSRSVEGLQDLVMVSGGVTGSTVDH